jgi:hypothetical protein
MSLPFPKFSGSSRSLDKMFATYCLLVNRTFWFHFDTNILIFHNFTRFSDSKSVNVSAAVNKSSSVSISVSVGNACYHSV